LRIAVLVETPPDEHRVAVVPESVARLIAAGAEVRVQRGAGAAARFPDTAYEAAGATVHDGAAEVLDGAGVVARVRRPSEVEARALPEGSILVCLMQARAQPDPLPTILAERRISALALERVPRITRAQAMDVLSSQSTVAGYKAALVGAAELDRFLPMLTTAAGAIAPARVFVIGAGVAGLQAIATARRLGAVVSAFDVRAAAAEQVQSLGATFVASQAIAPDAEAAGGYAAEQSGDEQERTRRTLADHIPNMDLVITTAQIPGKPAPSLITRDMVISMKPGSVIIDLAAESGGNCEMTKPDQTVEEVGVRVMGPTNLAATVPFHASQMFSRNVATLLLHLMSDGGIELDPDDEIVAAMLVNPAAGAAA
jgi:NAD(P) transhydrogenase subunit alpha